MQQIVADIRMELAQAGIEFTASNLEEVLNLGATLAACLGGYLVLDIGEHWGLEFEVDDTDPTGHGCFIKPLWFDDEDDNSDGEAN